jgi:hypothetical protein
MTAAGLIRDAPHEFPAIVVDTNGTKFRVLEMRKKRLLFSWRFGQILELLTGNPAFEVEMTFSAVSHISVDDVKDLLFKAFRKQQEYLGRDD